MSGRVLARGVVIRNDGLRVLDPVLRKWIDGVEAYCSHYGGQDAPYWYNERANVGLVAAAAWRSGGLALEEYPQNKASRPGGTWQGRADLWLSVETHEFVIEAKQCFPLLNGGTPPKTVVTKLLKAARQDATRSAVRNARSLGMVFVSPRSPKPFEDKRCSPLRDWIAELDSVDFDVMAWCFPETVRHLKSARTGHIYPGVVAVARMPRRPRQEASSGATT